MVLPDDEVCDYPFSIRIPKSMAQDISRRATAEGLSASAWARKALEFSLYEMGSDERKISAASLIELIKYNPEVKDALRGMYNDFMNSELVLCDEDGNAVELADKPISPIRRLKAKMHPDEEPLEFPDHIDTIHHIEKRQRTAKAETRKRKSSEKTADVINLDGRHPTMY